MNRLTELWRRVRLLFTRDPATRDLEEEMRLHVALRAEALQARGDTPSAAAAGARQRFGNRLRRAEEARDEWGFTRVDALVQDARYAARRLRQRPGFTAAVVTVLALGIGATTAMFSAVDAALLRPLPFARPSELMILPRINVPVDRSAFTRGPGEDDADLPPPFDYVAVSAMRETFAGVAAFASGGLNVTDEERPMRVNAGVVSSTFLSTLGVNPARGRLFTAADADKNAPRAVIISHGLWQRMFGATDAVGKTLSLNRRPYEIIGVMPNGFGFPGQSDLWIPMSIPTTPATFEAFRGFLPVWAVARLAPGVSAGDAESRMLARWERYLALMPERSGYQTDVERTVVEVRKEGAVMTLRDHLVGTRRQALVVLFGATVMLLLIACANVTNLLLAYGNARRRELAVRTVLGATRTRVVRQLLVESVILSLTGAAAGIGLAPILLRSLGALMPSTLAGVSDAQIDLRVLAFAAVVGALTGIVFGMWPALGVSRASASESINVGGGWGASAAGARRVQQWLVGVELALTVMLLVGAGLMLRSFERLTSVDSGMSVDHVATLELGFARGVNLAARQATVDGIVDRLRAIPGVGAVGVVNDLPLRGSGGISISIEAPGTNVRGDDRYIRYLVASEDYFTALGIQLRRGRFFARSDDERAPSVAIVSDSMAKLFWPGADPIGKTFFFGGDTSPTAVVGVVANVRESGLEEAARPQMYFPSRAQLGANLAVVARSTLPPRALLGHLTAAVRGVNRSQAVYNVRMMRDVVGAAVAPRRANTFLVTLFGVLALAVSTLGVYAVTSYAVSQRSREFGIRAALGAVSADLVRHVARDLAWLALAGLTAGAALAWALSRVMANLVYGVSIHDATTFLAAPALLVVAAGLAMLVPARRAARVNPLDVIRTE